MHDIEQLAELAIERPNDFAYWGDLDLFTTWGITGPSMHRDSDPLQVSNYETIKGDLEERFPEDIEVISANHWLVGWSDQVACRIYTDEGEITEAFKALVEWNDRLEEYPVADETHFCELEHEDFIETLENCYYFSSGRDSDGNYVELKDELPDNAIEQVAEYLFRNHSVCRSEELNDEIVDEAYIALGFTQIDEYLNDPC